ncbi:MAG: flagellar biosynthetic protein FliR [Hyphomicrobium sp.]|uniref:flagellar biosynthetic protein FliR n=1 Tax=Hyphomicrobium sp. TaxID=82 RepID=UPI003D0D3ABC
MLADLLAQNVFAFFLVFARVGSALILLPGVGEAYVSPRLRLGLGLALTLALTPVVAPLLPPQPVTAWALGLLLVGETIVGLFIGMIARILLLALEAAGMIVALQMGFASALDTNPATAQQASLIGNFMMALGVVLIFASNLHLPMIRAIVDSYTLFPAGRPPMITDMASMILDTVADAFQLAVELSAPFILLGLLFSLALGLLARLMPQLQVFFIALPIQILLGFVLLMVGLAVAMGWFLERFAGALPLLR